MTRARLLSTPASARRRLAGSPRRVPVRAGRCGVLLVLAALLVPAPASAETPEEASAPTAIVTGGVVNPAALPPRPNVNVPLSNDRDETTWAHPVEVLPIYVKPNVRSKEITHTRMVTEDGFPEVYLLLYSRMDSGGHAWVKVRVPGRPNGRVGWVLREALGGLHRTRWRVRINLYLRRLTAYYDDHKRFVAPVGVGKPSTPTPTGHFWIRERFKVSDPASPYFPWAIGTSAYSVLSDWPGGGIVGIHGPYGEPWQIPGDPSHGCVRMRDGDLARLAPMVTLGTPVDIV